MAYTTGILAGKYLHINGNPGSAASGVVEIIPSVPRILDSAGNVILSGRAKITLDGTGAFSTSLPATDDLTLNPSGVTYTVVAKLRHTHLAAVAGVVIPAGTTVQMADVDPGDPDAPIYAAQVTREEFDALVVMVGEGGGGSTVTVDADGTVTVDATTVELATDAQLLAHTSDTANPHSVTKTQVGLANVDNTSDASKPVSTAQAAADTAVGTAAATDATTKANAAQATAIAAAATDATTKANAARIPYIFQTKTTTYTAAVSEFVLANATSAGFTVTLPTAPATGSVVTVKKTDATANVVTVVGAGVTTIDGDASATIVTEDAGAVFEYDGTNWRITAITSYGAAASHTHAESDVTGLVSDLAAKAPLASPTFTGTVSGVTKGHVGLGSVDNTADTAKPVSTAQQTALNLKADLASPTFTGDPKAPTPSAGDNDTSIATTAFVVAGFQSALGTYAVTTASSGAGTYTVPTVAAVSLTITGNVTLAFTTPSTAGHTVMLRVSGAFTLTHPASVKWDAGAAPTYTTPALYVYTTLDTGTTWHGSQVGKAFA